MCLAFSSAATRVTAAESAAVSGPPSGRENTMIDASAVTCPCCGNACDCSVCARMDS